MIRSAFRIAVAAVFVGIVTVATGPAARADVAPDFQLQDLSGKVVHLSSLKFKVAIIDFWATWCPPCRAEMPHFKELYGTYHKKGLEIVGVSLDSSPEPVRQFVAEMKTPYRIVMGDDQISAAYGGIHGIPTTFVIDSQRNILRKYVGFRPKELFEQDVLSVIKKGPERAKAADGKL